MNVHSTVSASPNAIEATRVALFTVVLVVGSTQEIVTT